MDEELAAESQQKKRDYSPETFLSVAGNLEYVVGKVTQLTGRLRDAPFIDIDYLLNEIISSCKSISTAVENVEEIAQEYIRQLSISSDYTEECSLLGNLPEHDPGKRPAALSDSEKKYLIHLGPCQTKLNLFPKNYAAVKKSSHCRFAALCRYNEYPYLEYSISKDSAQYFVCSLFSTGIQRQKAEDAWITGIRSWHKMKGSQG